MCVCWREKEWWKMRGTERDTERGMENRDKGNKLTPHHKGDSMVDSALTRLFKDSCSLPVHW